MKKSDQAMQQAQKRTNQEHRNKLDEALQQARLKT